MAEPKAAKTVVIHLHRQAPQKPEWGQACNGCGVCCAYAPCPVGVVVSRRLNGACDALEWIEGEDRYRCGVLVDPGRYTGLKASWMRPVLVRAARRMISAGSGCDCSLEPERQG